MASRDHKLRDFLLAQSPAWLTERLLNAVAGDPVLLAGLEAAVEVAKRDGYEHAVSLLEEVGECYERVGASAEFADYVRSLRAAHRRKRTFIAALDTARLPA